MKMRGEKVFEGIERAWDGYNMTFDRDVVIWAHNGGFYKCHKVKRGHWERLGWFRTRWIEDSFLWDTEKISSDKFVALLTRNGMSPGEAFDVVDAHQ